MPTVYRNGTVMVDVDQGDVLTIKSKSCVDVSILSEFNRFPSAFTPFVKIKGDERYESSRFSKKSKIMINASCSDVQYNVGSSIISEDDFSVQRPFTQYHGEGLSVEQLVDGILLFTEDRHRDITIPSAEEICDAYPGGIDSLNVNDSFYFYIINTSTSPDSEAKLEYTDNGIVYLGSIVIGMNSSATFKFSYLGDMKWIGFRVA